MTCEQMTKISDEVAGMVGDLEAVQDFCQDIAFKGSGATLDDIDEDNEKGQLYWATYTSTLIEIMCRAAYTFLPKQP